MSNFLSVPNAEAKRKMSIIALFAKRVYTDMTTTVPGLTTASELETSASFMHFYGLLKSGQSLSSFVICACLV